MLGALASAFALPQFALGATGELRQVVAKRRIRLGSTNGGRKLHQEPSGRKGHEVKLKKWQAFFYVTDVTDGVVSKIVPVREGSPSFDFNSLYKLAKLFPENHGIWQYLEEDYKVAHKWDKAVECRDKQQRIFDKRNVRASEKSRRFSTALWRADRGFCECMGGDFTAGIQDLSPGDSARPGLFQKFMRIEQRHTSG